MAELIPSILVHDSDTYRKKIEQIEGLTDKVHIDFLDGKFVPNVSVPLEEIGSIPTSLIRTAHLMVIDPVQYFSQLTVYGFSEIFCHIESFKNKEAVYLAIGKASEYRLNLGLVLNPETMEGVLKPFSEVVSEVIIMTVSPGFSGQQAKKDVAGKIARIQRLYPRITVYVDGGINEDNIKYFFDLGVRKFIIGSVIFDGEPKYTIKAFNNALKQLEEGAKNI